MKNSLHLDLITFFCVPLSRIDEKSIERPVIIHNDLPGAIEPIYRLNCQTEMVNVVIELCHLLRLARLSQSRSLSGFVFHRVGFRQIGRVPSHL